MVMIMTIEILNNTIDNNNNIDAPLKENIKELIVIFNKMFPGVDLTNLNNRLATLKIEKSNKLMNKRVSKYNPVTNILEFNVDKIEQGYDMKYVMMYELLNIITSNSESFGFCKNNNFSALNAGYTAILANNLVGNESEIPFLEDEIISTNLISLLVGDEVMMESYFTNNVNLLANALLSEGVEL